ncbi:hypothetical protein LJK88_32255 [Paenibacillus sp. P26]|nr:hypothetical protein LJK88_32255 [Paenibacillus sp. P26]
MALPGGSLNQAHAASDASVVGTWMWDPYVIGKDKDGTLQKLMNRGVNRVYLFIDPTYAAESYRNFIKDARSKGIEVRAMSGAPNWVLPEYNKRCMNSLTGSFNIIKTHSRTNGSPAFIWTWSLM